MRPTNSLKNQIALLCVTLVAVCCLVLLLAFWLFTWENHRQHLARSMVHTDNVFRQYLDSREAVLATAAQVLTADFGFKQAVATRDADTIASALANHGARIGAELMWLLDINGNLIATSDDTERRDSSTFDWLTHELMKAPGQGYFVVLDNALQYLAGVGADPRSKRRFDIEKQTETYDPEEKFIRKWQGDAVSAQLDACDYNGWPIA